MTRRRNADETCHVCGKPALVGVTTDEGPVCYRHALSHMGVPVGEAEEERACRACGRVIDVSVTSPAYVEDSGFYHVGCLERLVKRLGRCPKCGVALFGDFCGSCYKGGVAPWIEQARKDAQAVLAAEGARVCALCLRHNRLVGPGYPFYPIERPQIGDKTCSRCFTAICDLHTIHLPKGNVLGISERDPICGGLPFAGRDTTCEGALEASVACSVAGCREADEKNYEALLEAKQCKKCGNWVCGAAHVACPDCEGVPCEDCGRLTPKDELLRFEEDAYTIRALCEECYSKREADERDEAWGNWLGRDFRGTLEQRFEVEDLSLDLSSVEDDALEALFDRACETCMIDWEGTDIDWRAAAMCVPVAAVLELPGAEIEGVPVSPNMALTRRVAEHLARVDELTSEDRVDADRAWRLMEERRSDRAQRLSEGSSIGTRSGRAAIRASTRRAMKRGHGALGDPALVRAVRALPRTVEGMRQYMDVLGLRASGRRGSYGAKRDLEILSRHLAAARRERNPDEERRDRERSADESPQAALRWFAERWRRGEAVSPKELVQAGLATGLRPVEMRTPNRQLLQSGHSGFDQQTTALGTGNVIGGTQYGNYIRRWDETENPVGQAVAPGHLTRFDLDAFERRRLPNEVRDFVENEARSGRQTILHEFFWHPRGSERRSTLGYVVTSGEDDDIHRVLGIFYVRRQRRSAQAVETAAQYVGWEPTSELTAARPDWSAPERRVLS